MRTKGHDLKECLTSVGGLPIEGFGETDAVKYEYFSELVESSPSADGVYVVVSRINDPRIKCTLTVKRESLACRQLFELAQVQAAQPTFLPMPYSSRNFITGDQVTDQYAIFQ